MKLLLIEVAPYSISSKYTFYRLNPPDMAEINCEFSAKEVFPLILMWSKSRVVALVEISKNLALLFKINNFLNRIC